MCDQLLDLEGGFVGAVIVACDRRRWRRGVAASAVTAAGASGLRDGGGGPTQAGADLVDGDLHDAALVPFLGLPRALLEATCDDHAHALLEGLGSRLGLIAPEGAAEEAGVFLPITVVVAPATVDGHADLRHRHARRSEPELGIFDEIADECDVVGHWDLLCSAHHN